MKFKKSCVMGISMLLLALLFSGCSFVISLPEPNYTEGSKIYDVNGQLITTLYKQKRTAVDLQQIPEITREAIIAVEDKNFYEHYGISPLGIIRAAWKNLRSGEVVEGGSTISQQTAKNLYLGNERTWSRKIKELWYTLLLEKKYSKDDILEMYLNQIYFGEGAYGIEEAAQTYFGKPAQELNLPESALLAGLPKAPSKYSPFFNLEAAKKRQRVVLSRMVDTKVISPAEAEEAAAVELIFHKQQKSAWQAPYFVNEVIKYVSEKYEDGANLLFTGGLRIDTTLDLDKQKAAERAFAKRLAEQEKDLEGGLLALDSETGYIVAMVGGRDFSTSKFNRSLQALRQPGSAFKPFVYAAAIDQGNTAATTLPCEPVEFASGTNNYVPTDSGSQPYHYRAFTLKEALQISDNVLAVKLANQVTPEVVADYARKMGIKSKLRPYLSLALGTSEVKPLEMAAAYASLANGGFQVEPVFIRKITDNNGVVLETNEPQRTPVLDPKTAFIVTDMLKSVVQPGGTASIVSSILPRPSAGKTGTTQNYADAWFVGYTPELVGAVYLGYDVNRKPVGSTGGKLAAPLWADFAAEALKDVPARDFVRPSGLVEANICADTGLLATPYSEKVFSTFFVSGTEPTQNCPFHSLGENDNSAPSEESPWEGEDPWEGFPRGRKRFFDWLF